MTRNRVKYSIVHLDSSLLILFLLLVSGVFYKSDHNKSDLKNQSTPTEISIIKSNAVISAGLHYRDFQKIWIPNKDRFELLSFNKSQFQDNNKADQIILISEKARKKSSQLQNTFIYCRLFPDENDEIPSLS
jgi:hypothetical protein